MVFEVGEHRRWRDIKRGPCFCDNSREIREPAALLTEGRFLPPRGPLGQTVHRAAALTALIKVKCKASQELLLSNLSSS